MESNIFINIIIDIVIVTLLSGIQVGLAQNQNETISLTTRSYISWDDMRVAEEEQRKRFSLFIGEGYKNQSRRVIVVDQNGGGDSRTVQGAVNMVPLHNSQRVKIYILPGIYREKVVVPVTKPYISFIGQENRTSDTVITWNNKASDKDQNGCELGTYRTASVTIESDFFCATSVTFENTVVALPGEIGMQAVALRVSGDKAMFYKVRVLGAQDTLLDELGSHYFYQSYVEGSVDFIFGRARSIYHECSLRSTAKRTGAIAAHHRDFPHEDTGFSFINCTISGTGKLYLGRAWGNYSRAIYSFCDMADIIIPTGWSDWNHPDRQKTADFAEYKCRGRGADTRARVTWSKNFTYEEVKDYLDIKFIYGNLWLRL